jgi:hypothetical protein
MRSDIPDRLVASLALGQPHHIGIVVPNLENAMGQMGPLVGDWHLISLPQDGVKVWTATGKKQVRLRAAQSVNGPMHVELLQSVVGSVWEPRDRAYIHHVGYWVPARDLVAISRGLDAAGMHREAGRWDESREPAGWAYHSWEGGGRIEIAEEGLPAPEMLVLMRRTAQ